MYIAAETPPHREYRASSPLPRKMDFNLIPAVQKHTLGVLPSCNLPFNPLPPHVNSITSSLSWEYLVQDSRRANPHPFVRRKWEETSRRDREFAAEMISSGARKISDVSVLISDQLTEKNSVEDPLLVCSLSITVYVCVCVFAHVWVFLSPFSPFSFHLAWEIYWNFCLVGIHILRVLLKWIFLPLLWHAMPSRIIYCDFYLIKMSKINIYN